MTYTSLELSKQLEALGLESKSEFYWIEWADGWTLLQRDKKYIDWAKKYRGRAKGKLIPKSTVHAFTLEDILRPENAKRIWPDVKAEDWVEAVAMQNQEQPWQIHTYAVLRLFQSGGEWQAYISSFLKKA